MITSKIRQVARVTLLMTISTLTPGTSADDAPAHKQTQSFQQDLSLKAALSRTLQHTPELQRFPFQEREAEALRLQAGLRPTPELNISIENALGTDTRADFNSAELTLGLSQIIELGNKRQARIGLSDARWQSDLAEYEITRLALLAETGRRYYQLLAQQAHSINLQQRAEHEKAALSVIEQRQRAGAVASADAAKMRLRLAQTETLRQRAQAHSQMYRAQLASLWLQSPDFSRASGNLLNLPAATDLPSLLQAVGTSPQVQQQRMLEKLAQAELQQQRALSRTDIKLGVGIRHFEQSNDQALVFDFSMPLALRNSNRGNLQAAHARKDWRENDLELTRQTLSLRLKNHALQLRALRQQAEQLRIHVLPKAESLLDEVELGYRQGRYSVLQWVDAQSELFELRAQQIDLHHNIFAQRLELEQISGQPLQNHTAEQPAPAATGAI